MLDTSVYIFIHSQELLDKLEKEQKFYKYFDTFTYVFLGDKKVETTIPNIIIVRDYEYNIEQYPKLVTFTGWYCLVKNNLIKTDKVILLEYDIDLADNFFKKTIELLDMNDIVSYLKMGTDDINFYNQINEVLIKHDYKIKDFFYWMVTTNIGIKTNTLIEIVNLLHDKLEFIKTNHRIGHIFERMVSYFAFILDKKISFLEGYLGHMMLDSHDTQGIHNRYVEYIKNI